MRTLAISAIMLAAAITSSIAGETPPPGPGATPPAVTLTLTDQDIANWANMKAGMDECIAGLELRNEIAVCSGLSAYLTAFAGRVQIAKQQAQQATVQPPPPVPLPKP